MEEPQGSGLGGTDRQGWTGGKEPRSGMVSPSHEGSLLFPPVIML